MLHDCVGASAGPNLEGSLTFWLASQFGCPKLWRSHVQRGGAKSSQKRRLTTSSRIASTRGKAQAFPRTPCVGWHISGGGGSSLRIASQRFEELHVPGCRFPKDRSREPQLPPFILLLLATGPLLPDDCLIPTCRAFMWLTVYLDDRLSPGRAAPITMISLL
jgi:hypothetical protein